MTDVAVWAASRHRSDAVLLFVQEDICPALIAQRIAMSWWACAVVYVRGPNSLRQVPLTYGAAPQLKSCAVARFVICNKTQSETADFAPGAATWRTRRNIRVFFELWPIPSCIVWSMTPSIKPEVHNTLHSRQKRTELHGHTCPGEIWTCHFRDMQGKRTDKQTNTLITILQTPIGAT